MHRAAIISLSVLFMLACVCTAHAQEEDLEREKLARTTMKFLNISADPRAAGLGDAVTALSEGSTSLFYNPAGMGTQTTFLDVAIAQTQWFVDVKYNFASMSVRPLDGRFGVFGVSVLAADYGNFEETIRADTEEGFVDLGTFSPSAIGVGLGYARALTDRFAVGGHARYVRQNLGNSVMSVQEDGAYDRADNDEAVFAFDFGMRYATGFESLVFAVTARNFARKVEYAEESYELPLLLKIGVSMNVLDLTNISGDMHSLVVGIDTESPRDYSEQIKVGGEYTFMNTISLRAGYVFPTDEQGINAGVGVHRTIGGLGIGADYAYTDFGVFSEVHRIGFQLSF
jgi:hypothetical protein